VDFFLDSVNVNEPIQKGTVIQNSNLFFNINHSGNSNCFSNTYCIFTVHFLVQYLITNWCLPTSQQSIFHREYVRTLLQSKNYFTKKAFTSLNLLSNISILPPPLPLMFVNCLLKTNSKSSQGTLFLRKFLKQIYWNYK